MILDEDAYLEHYGILRKSGRYPWGSGETQNVRNKTFLDVIGDLRRKGLTDTEIARGFSTDEHPFTTAQLRAGITIANNQQKQDQIRLIRRYEEAGLSNVAIGEKMGINESSVRSLKKLANSDKLDILQATSEMLKKKVEEDRFIDIGRGVEADLPITDGGNMGISKEKLNAAVALLKEEGYKVHYVKMPQIGTNNFTSVKVLTKPDVPYSEVRANMHNIKQVNEYSNDGGRSFLGLHPPVSVSSKRVGVRYAEEGGADADGVIYVRRGAKDLSLGGASYAQVRIAVDGSHYLKGMAIYKDDLPAGVDLVFNTNKSNTGNKLDAMKPMKKDADGNIDLQNPFTAAIKPGGQRGAFNVVNEEGDWDKWSKNLSSQVLSKQSPDLAKQQLTMTYERRQRDLNEILALTNPAVKKKLLETFADDADAASVHLKAAHLPRQRSQVLLPVKSIKPTEIYAPNFNDGERVALIRFPHAGTFEIPELTVNNKNPEAKRLLGPQAKDAVGINSKVAERLSGADFDGDSVIVIPNDRGLIKSAAPLEGLKNFDPQTYKFAKDDPTPRISPSRKQTEMGLITNLIADMSIKGAGPGDLARAVRHSMVVIDSEKHELNFKASERDNGIAALKTKYQGGAKKGASTLITKTSSEIRTEDVRLRRASEGGPIDKATGKKMFRDAPESFINKDGVVVTKKVWAKRGSLTDDATTLLSENGGTPIERVYADHSNRLKALANTARKEYVSVKAPPVNKSAKKVYSNELASLNAKLNIALKNAPLERQAQVLANSVVSQMRQANPGMESAQVKRISNQALAEARKRTGAKKQRVEITPAEWIAIQAGAVSDNQLRKILNNSDMDVVRQLATPRIQPKMTSSMRVRAEAMLNRGFTQAEIASQLGVSLTTLKTSIAE